MPSSVGVTSSHADTPKLAQVSAYLLVTPTLCPSSLRD